MDMSGMTMAWPGATLGAMGPEGAVRLAGRKELEAIPDRAAREQRVRALNAFLHDLYHRQEIVRAGRLPSIGVFGDTVSVFANVTNWRFVAVGRAAPLRLVSPFIPQWSLSVEEQFYLV